MSRLKENRSLIVIVILLIIFALVIFRMGSTTSENVKRKHVSMVVYGDDPDRWENMRQGASLVCEERNADLALITMLSEDDTAEQKEIIEREIEDGTDALIIAACQSNGIREYISGRKIRVPVVFVESMEDVSEKIIDIAADDYKMGHDLGEALVQNESDIVTVAIISENTQRDSVMLREKGFRDAIDGNVGKVINWTRQGDEKTARTRTFIQKAIVSEAADVFVSFDNSITDELLDALTNLNESRKVYAISTSDKAVYNLYNQTILVLEYPDEYSMGYLAAMNALDASYASKKYPDRQIEYRTVRKENMYDEDNQTILFPFVN